MPHVIVKMYAGPAEAQKQALADEITQAAIKTLGYGDDAVPVSIEDVAPRDWAEKVYRPDIVDKPGQLYKMGGLLPGFGVMRLAVGIQQPWKRPPAASTLLPDHQNHRLTI